MNAQEKWKRLYRKSKNMRAINRYDKAVEYMLDATRFSREAALERKLEAANRRIAELEYRVWQLEAQEHNSDDGNEWEKEYYLRGIHR